MLSTAGLISLLIRDKYTEIKKFSKDSSDLDIYDLTPHPPRYNILKYTLKLISLPITALVQTTKFVTLGALDLKYLNVSKIFLDKMNQNISKKILHGLPEENENEQTIPEIIEYVFKKYEEHPNLIEQPKPSLTSKIIQAIPGSKKLMNFWDQGGIKYSDEIEPKIKIIDFIYKIVISKAYSAGKKGEKLEIADVKACFPEIDFEEKPEIIAVPVQSEKIVINNEHPVACELPSNDILISPLVNLMILKALHDRIQKMAAEHHLAEYFLQHERQKMLEEQYIMEQLIYSENACQFNYNAPQYYQPINALGEYYEYGNSNLVECY